MKNLRARGLKSRWIAPRSGARVAVGRVPTTGHTEGVNLTLTSDEIDSNELASAQDFGHVGAVDGESTVRYLDGDFLLVYGSVIGNWIDVNTCGVRAVARGLI